MWEDPKVVAAVIAAVTSIISLLLSSLIKSIYERKIHKLRAGEHRGQGERTNMVLLKVCGGENT